MTGYTYHTNNISFDYCIGDENSIFALSELLQGSYIRIKIFNFGRLYDSTYEYFIGLEPIDFAGIGNITHTISLDELPSDYKLGGRIYFEYHLYVSYTRIAVARRFYDIEGWKMPPANDGTSSIVWAAILTVIMLIFVVYFVYHCNKRCQKLEHEKSE